jgi:hypothetical protein
VKVKKNRNKRSNAKEITFTEIGLANTERPNSASPKIGNG